MLLKIEVTKNCDQACSHCSYSRKYSTNTKDLTLNKLKNIFFSYKANKSIPRSFEVLLTGGEPLLNPEIFDIINFLHNNGANYISLATNAIPFINNEELKQKNTSFLSKGTYCFSFSK